MRPKKHRPFKEAVIPGTDSRISKARGGKTPSDEAHYARGEKRRPKGGGNCIAIKPDPPRYINWGGDMQGGKREKLRLEKRGEVQGGNNRIGDEGRVWIGLPQGKR